LFFIFLTDKYGRKEDEPILFKEIIYLDSLFKYFIGDLHPKSFY